MKMRFIWWLQSIHYVSVTLHCNYLSLFSLFSSNNWFKNSIRISIYFFLFFSLFKCVLWWFEGFLMRRMFFFSGGNVGVLSSLRTFWIKNIWKFLVRCIQNLKKKCLVSCPFSDFDRSFKPLYHVFLRFFTFIL